jgi:flagellar basal body P-ring protein FlgI
MRKLGIWTMAVMVSAGLSCQGSKPRDARFDQPAIYDKPVGDLARIFQYEAVAVKGFGLAGSLAGTGSGECPPALRTALISYIRKQLPKTSQMNPNELIDNKNTAVVEIYGVIPQLASKGDTFDLMVRSIPRTQTTSVRGGRLYTAEMKELSRFFTYDQFIKSLARAEGQIFTDDFGDAAPDEKKGYILGGGIVDEEVRISLVLKEPNYYTINAIRNQLIQRFGPKTAKAVSPEEIELTVPDMYQNRRDKFIQLVLRTYLVENEASLQERVRILAEALRTGPDKTSAELGLESIGKQSLFMLGDMLSSPDETVRFHAARCMLNIGDDRGLDILQKIVDTPQSSLRLEAIAAVGTGARKADASRILSRPLEDNTFEIKLAAYEQLARIGDIRVARKLIGGDFFVDTVSCSGPKTIYISRKDFPRITLFGGDIPCEKSVFVETPNRRLTANARPGDPYLSLIRTHSSFPRPIGPLGAKYDTLDIIRTACEQPSAGKKPGSRPGLGASYSDIVLLLDRMCRMGAIRAEFRLGPMTEATKLQPPSEPLPGTVPPPAEPAGKPQVHQNQGR